MSSTIRRCEVEEVEGDDCTRERGQRIQSGHHSLIRYKQKNSPGSWRKKTHDLCRMRYLISTTHVSPPLATVERPANPKVNPEQ